MATGSIKGSLPVKFYHRTGTTTAGGQFYIDQTTYQYVIGVASRIQSKTVEIGGIANNLWIFVVKDLSGNTLAATSYDVDIYYW